MCGARTKSWRRKKRSGNVEKSRASRTKTINTSKRLQVAVEAGSGT